MKNKWQVIDQKDCVMLCRFSGKTFPCITFFKASKVLSVRNDNGQRPSAEFETTDISEKGIKLLSTHITGKLPDDFIVSEFLWYLTSSTIKSKKI